MEQLRVVFYDAWPVFKPQDGYQVFVGEETYSSNVGLLGLMGVDILDSVGNLEGPIIVNDLEGVARTIVAELRQGTYDRVDLPAHRIADVLAVKRMVEKELPGTQFTSMATKAIFGMQRAFGSVSPDKNLKTK